MNDDIPLFEEGEASHESNNQIKQEDAQITE
jgi:hypothetical protein